MLLFQKFIKGLQTATKWVAVVAAFAKAVDLFYNEIKDLDLGLKIEEND